MIKWHPVDGAETKTNYGSFAEDSFSTTQLDGRISSSLKILARVSSSDDSWHSLDDSQTTRNWSTPAQQRKHLSIRAPSTVALCSGWPATPNGSNNFSLFHKLIALIFQRILRCVQKSSRPTRPSPFQVPVPLSVVDVGVVRPSGTSTPRERAKTTVRS